MPQAFRNYIELAYLALQIAQGNTFNIRHVLTVECKLQVFGIGQYPIIELLCNRTSATRVEVECRSAQLRKCMVLEALVCQCLLL